MFAHRSLYFHLYDSSILFKYSPIPSVWIMKVCRSLTMGSQGHGRAHTRQGHMVCVFT